MPEGVLIIIRLGVFLVALYRALALFALAVDGHHDGRRRRATKREERKISFMYYKKKREREEKNEMEEEEKGLYLPFGRTNE